MTLKFTMPMGGSNDNYHHISANDSEIVSQADCHLAPRNRSLRQEMFDVCFAMFDVTMSSQQNWK
jgi:hypothetical protein